MGDVSDGGYHLLGINFTPSMTVGETLAGGSDPRVLVCDRPPRVCIRNGVPISGNEVSLVLRSRRITDPPLVSAIALLLARSIRAARSGRAPRR